MDKVKFKAHIGKNHVWAKFTTPDNLEAKVATGLAEIVTRFQLLDDQPVPVTSGRLDFYKHIQLPPNYVPRNDLLAELRVSLLGDENIALTSAIKGATALHGMGGIGKSVMARALCDDPTVQAAFPDGILWTTLGQTPNLATKLGEWVDKLGGVRSENVPTVDSLKSDLAELLENRSCLLIVDDVWQKNHVEVFRVGGENCRLLITTRDTEIARGIGANVQPIPTMSNAEALALLNEWADGNLTDANKPTLMTIVTKLGRLPLAIKLAGSQLQRKSPERFLERFDARKLKDKRDEDVHASLEMTFGLSLDELEDTERQLYAALAIFKEDEPIREQAIARLWSGLADWDDDETEDLIDDLAARALLEVVGEEYPRAAVLHDLLRDFMAAELNDPQETHTALLDAYRETQTGDGWHTMPDDGYIYDNIAYHLLRANRVDTLRQLIADFRFMQAKLSATNPIALALDAESLSEEPMPNLMASFWRMSAHILSDSYHHNQLHNQIIGRLGYHAGQYEAVDNLLATARAYNDQPALILQQPTLNPAGGMLQRILKGHAGELEGVIRLRDGRILSWSEDRTLRLWSVEGELLAVLSGHSKKVSRAHELSDGHILSWSADDTLRLWSAEGEPLAVLEGHTERIENAQVLKDGCILSWSADDTLRLWSAEGEPLAVLEGHTEEINGAIQLYDGRILSWSDDRSLRLWSAEGEPLAVLEGHPSKVQSALQLSDGRILSWPGAEWSGTDDKQTVDLDDDASDDQDNQETSDLDAFLFLDDEGNLDDMKLRLWSADGELLAVLAGHTGEINGAIELPNSNLLSWSEDHTLRLWSPQGTPLSVLTGHICSVMNVLELSSGYILSWSGGYENDDYTLRLWSSNGASLAVLQGHTHKIEGVRELRDGRILSWSQDHTLHLWSAEGEPLTVLQGHTDHVVDSLELEDGRILSLSMDATMRLWSAEGELQAILEGHADAVLDVVELDNARLISCGGDQTICLWNLRGDALNANSLAQHEGRVTGILELSDNRLLSWARERLYSFAEDPTLRLWSAEGKLVTVLQGHTVGVRDVLELRNGRILSWAASWKDNAEKEKNLRLWLPDGTPLAVLEGHTDNVSGALELSNGRILSWSGGFGSNNHTLRLWSAEGEPLAVLEGHTNPVAWAQELRNGRILSWADDNTLRLWSAEGEPLAVLEGHTNPVAFVRELRDGRILSWPKPNRTDKTLRLWTPDGEPLTPLKGYTHSVKNALELSSGCILSWSAGERFAEKSNDHKLYLWSAAGELQRVLEGHIDEVSGAMELFDGRILSWDASDVNWLWSAEGERLRAFRHFYDRTSLRSLEPRKPNDSPLTWGYGGEWAESYHAGNYVCQIVLDSGIEALQDLRSGGLAVGDGAGKVHVFQPNAALHQLLNDVDGFIEQLKSESASIRKTAARKLGATGDSRAVDPLIQILDDSDAEVRQSAVDALRKLNDTRSIEPLLQMLGDEDIRVRRCVVEALHKIGGSQVIAPLINLLQDDNYIVQGTAAEVLGRLGDTQACDPLMAVLSGLGPFRSAGFQNNDRERIQYVVDSVIRALYQLGDSGFAVLLGALQYAIRRYVAKVLGQLWDKRAVEPLIGLLTDAQSEVRAAAAEALGNLRDKRAVEPLIAALHDEDSYVQKSVVTALGYIGDERAHQPLLPLLGWQESDSHFVSISQVVAQALYRLGDTGFQALLDALHHDDNAMRRGAAEGLGFLDDMRAIELLVDMLQDKQDDIRQAAAKSLGHLGDTGFETLLQLLDDVDSDVRCVAAQVLGESERFEAVDPLIEVLADGTSGEVRWVAAEALGNLRYLRAIDPLIQALKDADSKVRCASAGSLAIFSDERIVEPLIQALDDDDSEVRRAVVGALGTFKDERIIEPLAAALNDLDSEVRNSAVLGLVTFGDERAIEPLIEYLNHEDERERAKTVMLLEKFYKENSRIVEAIIPMLQDNERIVRSVTIEALGELNDRRAVEPLVRHLITLLDQNEIPVMSVTHIGLVVKALQTLEPSDDDLEPLIQFLNTWLNKNEITALDTTSYGVVGELQSLDVFNKVTFDFESLIQLLLAGDDDKIIDIVKERLSWGKRDSEQLWWDNREQCEAFLVDETQTNRHRLIEILFEVFETDHPEYLVELFAKCRNTQDIKLRTLCGFGLALQKDERAVQSLVSLLNEKSLYSGRVINQVAEEGLKYIGTSEALAALEDAKAKGWLADKANDDNMWTEVEETE